MTCCRCNRTGRCRNCSCVKASKHCQSCLPSRLGQCSNYHASSPKSTTTCPGDSLTTTTTTSVPQPLPSSSIPSGTAVPVTTCSSITSASAHSVSATIPATTPSTTQVTTPDTTPVSHHSEASHLATHSQNDGMQTSTLPDYLPMANPTFAWGIYDSASISNAIDRAYKEVVHWRRNLYPVPQGKAGMAFVSELSCLYSAYADGSALESIALKATFIAPLLLLQRPQNQSNMLIV